MYDDLVKRLRLISKSHGELIDLYGEAADAIEELQQTVEQMKAIVIVEAQHTEMFDERDKQTLMEMAKSLPLQIIPNKDEKPRWIPVTERLPEEDGWYQVYAPGYSGGSSSGLKNINGNMYSAFKHGKWSIEIGYHKRPGCVKAWMPLPPPPKEVE